MKRHTLDLVSLVAGAVLLLVATSYLVEAAGDVNLDLGWLVPVALVAIGIAGLAGALRRPSDAEDQPGSAPRL